MNLVKRVFIFAAAVMILNLIYLHWAEARSKKIDLCGDNRTYAEDYSESNYIIYIEKNGIRNAPLIFGYSIYLYSIKDDKKYLIANSKKPLIGYVDNMSFSGEHVFYQKTDFKGDNSGKMEKVELSSGNKERFEIDNDYYYIVSDNICFWTENSGIYRYDLETGAKELFLKSELSYEELTIKDDCIYALNENTGNLDVISLKNKEVRSYPLNRGSIPGCINIIDENTLILTGLWSGSLLEYNTKNHKIREIASIVKKDYAEKNGWRCESLGIRNEYIYCNDEKYDIVKLNRKTGEIKKIVDISEFMTDGFDEEAYVDFYVASYCKNYIAIQILYTMHNVFNIEVQKKDLLIFDYEGNLIKQKKLNY